MAMHKNVALAGLLAAALMGCEEGPNLTIERLPDVSPNLPAVPELPPPPHPINHPDGSYSVYGVRQMIANTAGQEVTITGTIVSVYAPPACDEGEACPLPPAPHVYIADTAGESDQRLTMIVTGYAQNHEEVADARRGGSAYLRRAERQGIVPVPIDFDVGARIKVVGTFDRQGNGFFASNGLVQYQSHETLEAAPESEE